MKHKDDNTRLLGAVVTGTKPWNSDYNIGLVVAQAKTTESFRIMWMRHKDTTATDRFIDIPSKGIFVRGKIIYTWEHPTSVAVLSRNECYG